MTTTTFGLDVFRRELLKGSTETLILSLLAGQEMYGYQLAKEMEKKSGGYFHLKEGTLYPALHRLERDGMIEGHWELSQSGQSRRYYHVSTPGHGPPRRHARRMEHVLGRREPDRSSPSASLPTWPETPPPSNLYRWQSACSSATTFSLLPHPDGLERSVPFVAGDSP